MPSTVKVVGEIVRDRELYKISRDVTALEAARYMEEKKIGAVCVCSRNFLVGILSERDLMSRVIVKKRNARRTPVREIMTQNVLVADAGETIQSCIGRMQKAGVRHLPIIENKKLMGIVSIRDLLMREIDRREIEVQMLASHVSTRSPATGTPKTRL
jgi:CBS domain-containing protein